MPISRSPGGTRGARTLPAPIARVMMPMMQWVHRRTGDRFRGSDLLYLTTVGARSGEHRTNPVARFDDGGGGWLVVASFGGRPGTRPGTTTSPRIPTRCGPRLSGTTHHVHAQQLDDAAHEAAWAQITARAPGFLAYAEKTDRRIPVLRSLPARPPVPERPAVGRPARSGLKREHSRRWKRASPATCSPVGPRCPGASCTAAGGGWSSTASARSGSGRSSSNRSATSPASTT